MEKSTHVGHLIFAVVITLIALLFLGLSFNLGSQSGHVPLLVSAAMVTLCCCLIVYEMKGKKQKRNIVRRDGDQIKIKDQTKKNDTPEKQQSFKRSLIIMVLTFLYCGAISILGFFISTMIVMITGPYLCGFRNIKTIIVNVIIFLLIYYLGFQTLLNIRFPSGILF